LRRRDAVSFTLHLDDVVAETLRQEASALRVPPEELANRLVREALRLRIAERQWESQNRRRPELIANKGQAGLSPAELEEFTQLQELAGARAAPSDHELRRSLADLQRADERLPSGSTP
jgi:hypothetical protein